MLHTGALSCVFVLLEHNVCGRPQRERHGASWAKLVKELQCTRRRCRVCRVAVMLQHNSQRSCNSSLRMFPFGALLYCQIIIPIRPYSGISPAAFMTTPCFSEEFFLPTAAEWMKCNFQVRYTFTVDQVVANCSVTLLIGVILIIVSLPEHLV